MSTAILISILLIQFEILTSNLLNAESNLQKPKLERNNIVNKRVWMKNKFKDNSYEKASLGDFIFRANSLDVDNMLQNNFDAFGEDHMQETPLITSYVNRSKRSADALSKQRSAKSMKKCKDLNCKKLRQISENRSDSAESKIINELKPASVFNDYPYEVAILLNNNKRDYIDFKSDNLNKSDEISDIRNNNSINSTEPSGHNYNNETTNITQSKRSKKYNFETEVIKKFELIEDLNKTGDKIDGKYGKNVFDRDYQVWHKIASATDVYKVLPKEPPKNKPVTERGLIKVISMLTKTFKKIMRQHNEIKDMHSKTRDMSDDFSKNAAVINEKLQAFDLKYAQLMKFNVDLKNFEQKLLAKEEYFKTKEREMASSLSEFENQQRKFLTQQQQFYNIQKLMLAQNEKINIKQNQIAKTQSEISYKQNNFARILKKAKQLYIDSKNLSTNRLTIAKGEKFEGHKQEMLTTTSTAPPTTESIKINLFSIPVSNKLEDQDDLIMKEKDEQPIDDLVYKYYFNNTFIDSLMKNQVLSGIVAAPDGNNIARNVKTKRDDTTTLLLPVNDSNVSIIFKGLNRRRRWINHHSRHRNRRKYRGKEEQITIINATDDKLFRAKVTKNSIPMEVTTSTGETKKSPFITMAVNFCNELQANMNQQMKDWCVEKALRRLQYIDISLFPQPMEKSTITPPLVTKEDKDQIARTPGLPTESNVQVEMREANVDPVNNPLTSDVIVPEKEMEGLKTETVPTDSTPISGITVSGQPPMDMTSPSLVTKETMYTMPTYAIQEETPVFFPDNDELESNLKQFDLKPDTDGNVYYEGSLHASEVIGQTVDTDSEFTDDFMPGLESNSRVEIDPLAFDLQAKRRAYIRQLNERIKKTLG